MIKKNKLILIETEMLEPKGHFLNNLIDANFFFYKKFDIYWLLNKNFDSKGTYIPKNINKIYSISTNKFKRKSNKFLYFLEEIYLFFKNIIYTILFLFLFVKKNKLSFYISALKSNYFIIPKYFKSFYFAYEKLNLNKEDHVFFPTGRRKDLALINFISKLDENHPKFHLRTWLPQKKKFKGFFYYLREIDIKLKKKRIFIYVWKNNFKLFLENSLSKKGIYETNLMFSYNPNSLFNRKIKKKLTIGYIGHARRERGFHHLPQLINLLEEKKYKFSYLIQFSKINDDLIDVKKNLYHLSKKNNRIKLIEKYSNHKEFVNYLKKIDIMPVLHNADEISNITSGSAYSCVPYQIPFILPVGTDFINNINKFKSFEKAKNINDMAIKIIKISKSYDLYLKNAKLNSRLLKKIVANDPLIINLN